MSNHGSPDRTEDNRSWQSAGGNNFNATQPNDIEEVNIKNSNNQLDFIINIDLS